MPDLAVAFEEGDRQMVLLALAELALSRPGWDDALGRIADSLSLDGTIRDGRVMFNEFKRLNADRVKGERLPMWMHHLVAQNDDPELLEWLAKADKEAGGYLQHLAHAGLAADTENYPILRPVLIEMRKKYPAYEPSDAVKQEIHFWTNQERGK